MFHLCSFIYSDHHVRNALLNEMQVFGECNITAILSQSSTYHWGEPEFALLT